MSKLTNWLNNDDDLDIQSIVDKYEQELLNNQNNKDLKINLSQEIWSEKLDENDFNTSSRNNNLKTIEFSFDDKNSNNSSSLNSNSKKNNTICFDSLIQEKQNNTKIPPPININCNKKPVVPPCPPPINQIKKDNLIDQNIIDIKKINTKIIDKTNNQKENKKNTIIFKNQTEEFEQNSQNQKIENDFSNNKEFLKSLQENDFKTYKLQPDDNEIKFKQPIKQQKIKEVNEFNNDSLTAIFFNETQKVQDITKEINQADAINLNLDKNKKKRKNDFKNEQKNQFKTKVPKFLKQEVNFLLTNTILSFIFLFITLGLIGYVLYLFLNFNYSIYLIIPCSILSTLAIYASSINLYRYKKLHKEIKDSNYEINKELPLISLKKIYKRLIIANINLNWGSFLTYSLCGLGIFLTFIVTYFMNLINYAINDFGNLIFGVNDPSPMIAVWTQASLVFMLIPFQIIFNIINKRRMDNINMFYQKEIISDELVMKYQKQARKKWKIIYFSIIILVGLIVLITWLILRKKSKK